MGKGNPGGKFNEKIFPGAKFGRLTVVERLPREQGKHRYIYRVLCQCECGGESQPEVNSLISGSTTSCGCRKRECGAENAAARIIPGEGYGKVVPGAIFGRLTVIKRIKKEDRYTGRVKCQCECGNIHKPLTDDLVNESTKSCGCLNNELRIQRNKDTAKFRGFSTKYPRTWMRWWSMLARCYRKSSTGYKDYGAKGIVVCDYLRESPWHLKELIGLCKKIKPSLDRFPTHSGNYTCGQCVECVKNGWELNIRWATYKEQNNNKGNNVHLTAFGKTLTRSQWQDLSGIDEWRIHRRINELGWSVEKALTTPNRKGNCYKPND